MSDLSNVENLVLEHLRHIRARVDQIGDDVGELKMRMSNVEAGIARVRREVLQADETDIRQQMTLDKLTARIERIERRLDLAEPQH